MIYNHVKYIFLEILSEIYNWLQKDSLDALTFFRRSILGCAWSRKGTRIVALEIVRVYIIHSRAGAIWRRSDFGSHRKSNFEFQSLEMVKVYRESNSIHRSANLARIRELMHAPIIVVRNNGAFGIFWNILYNRAKWINFASSCVAEVSSRFFKLREKNTYITFESRGKMHR